MAGYLLNFYLYINFSELYLQVWRRERVQRDGPPQQHGVQCEAQVPEQVRLEPLLSRVHISNNGQAQTESQAPGET